MASGIFLCGWCEPETMAASVAKAVMLSEGAMLVEDNPHSDLPHGDRLLRGSCRDGKTLAGATDNTFINCAARSTMSPAQLLQLYGFLADMSNRWLPTEFEATLEDLALNAGLELNLGAIHISKRVSGGLSILRQHIAAKLEDHGMEPFSKPGTDVFFRLQLVRGDAALPVYQWDWPIDDRGYRITQPFPIPVKIKDGVAMTSLSCSVGAQLFPIQKQLVEPPAQQIEFDHIVDLVSRKCVICGAKQWDIWLGRLDLPCVKKYADNQPLTFTGTGAKLVSEEEKTTLEVCENEVNAIKKRVADADQLADEATWRSRPPML